jgi:glycosyltransferase involved in cell wall biosynthesis
MQRSATDDHSEETSVAVTTCVVVPCYNEAARLPVDRFAAFLAARPDTALLFVNDGSADRTGDRLEEIRGAVPGRVQLIELPRNAGKGEAVRRGMLEAMGRSPAYVGFWDADLSTPLQTIPEFVALLDGRPDLEWVTGARVQLLGRDIRRSPLRHYLGRIFATAVSLTLGLAVYDTQCGAKLFRATPAFRALLEEPFLSRWIFDVELYERLIRQRRLDGGPGPESVVYEYPLPHWEDVRGSKVGPADFFRALIELARIHHRYRYIPPA